MNPLKVQFHLTTPTAVEPQRVHAGDACFDLTASSKAYLYPLNADTGEGMAPMRFLPYPSKDYVDNGYAAAVETGVRVVMPIGWEMQIRPRSGLAFKKGITIINSPGTVDSGYCKEDDLIRVILINLGDKPFRVEVGDRIAQCCFKPVYEPEELRIFPYQGESFVRSGSPERLRMGGYGSSGVGAL